MMASTNELSVGASRCSCMSSASRAPSTARLSVGVAAAPAASRRARGGAARRRVGGLPARRALRGAQAPVQRGEGRGSPKRRELKRSYHTRRGRRSSARCARGGGARRGRGCRAVEWRDGNEAPELTALVQAQGSAAAEESSRAPRRRVARQRLASTSSMCSSVAAPSIAVPCQRPHPRRGGEASRRAGGHCTFLHSRNRGSLQTRGTPPGSPRRPSSSPAAMRRRSASSRPRRACR